MLKGVGYNWSNESFDYIIGDFTSMRKYDMPMITACYPDAEYAEINLPDEGWVIYHSKRNELSKLYEEIYIDGALEYEIEEFYPNGDCTISIIRV
jgi:hypothetical protein